jgi:hypothetical protein
MDTLYESLNPAREIFLVEIFALADLKAIQFLKSPCEVTTNQLARWTPQLIAMHRKYHQVSSLRF